MQIKNLERSYTPDGECKLLITLPKSEKQAVERALQEFQAKPDKRWQATVGIEKEVRSLQANNYMWQLCGEIARVIQSTKEEVYRSAIREVGMCEDFPEKNEKVQANINLWNTMGTGYFAEELRFSRLEGYTVIRRYYGSHLYDKKTMSTLVDYVAREAQGLDIETKTPEQIERVMSLWK